MSDWIITRSGAYKKENDKQEMSRIIQKFTIITPILKTMNKTIKQAFAEGDVLCIPRFAIKEICSEYDVRTSIKDTQKVIFERIPTAPVPYDYQTTITKKLIEKHYSREDTYSGEGGCILKLKAGTGKTMIGLLLMEKIQRKTAIIVHSVGMIYQWRDVISSMFSNRCSSLKKYTDEDIVVGCINSFLKLPMAFFKQFGFIIYDECHLYCSQKRADIFRKAQALRVLGITATPNRLDGFGKVSSWWLGDIEDHCYDVKTDDVKFTCDVTIVKYTGSPEYTKIIKNDKLDVIDSSKTLKEITLDPRRVEVISSFIVGVYRKGGNIFVFSDRISYLEKLIASMKDVVPRDKIMLLTGGASDEELKKAELESNIIFTTYAFMSVGKSIKKMNALVMATPRKSNNEQTVNRIFRLGSDVSVRRTIIDFVDVMLPSLRRQGYLRKMFYESEGYDVTEIDTE